MDQVYNSQLAIKDYIGLPVPGARVTFNLVNGTQLSGTSGADGFVTLRMIPLGTYNATVSYLGQNTRVEGDASTRAIVEGRVFTSYPMFGVIGLAAVVVAILGTLLFRRFSKRQ